MDHWRDYHRDKSREIRRTKLYLLMIGVLILGTLLFYEKKGMQAPETAQEGQREGRQTEEETPMEDAQEEEPEMAEETEEPEVQPLEYNGNIRVLLRTDHYEGELHGEIQLSSGSGQDLTVYDGENGETIESGNSLAFTREEDTLFLNGEPMAAMPERMVVKTAEGDGAGIAVESVARNSGIPVYEGALEIWPVQEGFYLVNDLPFETYLKYVVPSEMPSGYSMEALKAQAVCARTYACKQLQSFDFPACEAHVDDSVIYQVYNNTGAAESTSQAVDATSGMILTSGGLPITAYYFSTSCGATGNEEIWWEGDASLTPYLCAKTVDAAGEAVDLSEEEAFEKFLEEENEGCYDAGISWYRWEAEADLDTLTDNVNAALKSRYEANPEAVLTEENGAFVSKEIESIGRIQGIEVLERNEGGAIVRLQIRGSENTIQVLTEYNVRALLNLQGCNVVRSDGTLTAGASLLPSACVVITPVFGSEGELAGWRFEGGGYGHGVGLSQNGANTMAKQGMSFEKILGFYYTGAELTAITDLW